jgi:hypothetical protein
MEPLSNTNQNARWNVLNIRYTSDDGTTISDSLIMGDTEIYQLEFAWRIAVDTELWPSIGIYAYAGRPSTPSSSGIL